MTPVTAKTAVKVYLIMVLLIAVLASPLPQLGIALALLAIQLGTLYRPVKASIGLALTLGLLIFTPLALEALTGTWLSVFLISPTLLLLDQSLRQNAASQIGTFVKTGKSLTSVCKALATSLLLVLAASIILLNFTLMLTATILIGYLGAILGYLFFKIPNAPFEESKTFARIIAGNTAEEKAQLKGKSGVPLFVSLVPTTAWVQIAPSNLMLAASGKSEFSLRFRPPLAGPSKLSVQALAVDPWGLTQVAQVLEPVNLHIIPRVKYARWLANKYLEQTTPGTDSAVSASLSDRFVKAANSGLEYYGSHQFQPGDRWKDMDWKHTYLFGELIVKEFSGLQGRTAVLVADLTAKDAEEADKLSYDFVMAALTFATESLPTALAVYNHQEVLAAMPPMNPREALKKTLSLTEKISRVEPTEKVLQAVELAKLKRAIKQLDQADNNLPLNLSEILKIELKANKKAANSHPSSQALDKIIDTVAPPATLTVVSASSNNNSELVVTLERLKEKGYSIIKVEAK